jgi:hypothetical protein
MCGSVRWESQRYTWLTIVDGDEGGPTRFVFAVGGHPMRAYRGDPEDAPQRYLQMTFLEEFEQEKARAVDGTLPQGRFLRIAIENDPTGRPDTISLNEVSEASVETLRRYMIPRLARTTTITEFAALEPAVEIPPVQAEPITNVDAEENEDKTGSDDE